MSNASWEHNRKHSNPSLTKDGVCFYKVLGVSAEAKVSDIRRRYMKLARAYHPDKAHLAANPQGIDKPDGVDDHDMFSLVARAYETLSDPAKRQAYDLLHGHGQGGVDRYDQLDETKRAQAEHEVEMMRVSFDVSRSRELARGGLVIDDAVYGSRSIVEGSRLDDLSESSEDVVNVTRQLQCAVENSKLVIPAGEPKYSWLPGVYDPAYGKDKLLWVRYFFRGQLHRALVGDDQRLLIPLKSHCISGRQRAENKAPRKSGSRRACSRPERQQFGKRQTRSERATKSRLPPIVWLGALAALGVTGALGMGYCEPGIQAAVKDAFTRCAGRAALFASSTKMRLAY